MSESDRDGDNDDSNYLDNDNCLDWPRLWTWKRLLWSLFAVKEWSHSEKLVFQWNRAKAPPIEEENEKWGKRARHAVRACKMTKRTRHAVRAWKMTKRTRHAVRAWKMTQIWRHKKNDESFRNRPVLFCFLCYDFILDYQIYHQHDILQFYFWLEIASIRTSRAP